MKSIANALNKSLLCSGIIFSTAIEYGTSSWNINSDELFNWLFSYLLCGWLVGTTNAFGSSCSRYGNFSIDNDDSLKQIQATNCCLT